MSQLPYDLRFVHQFNLYQGAGMSISEDDIPAIARMYGVTVERLQAIEDEFMHVVAGYAAYLRNIIPIHPADTPYRIIAIGDSMTADRTGYVNILRAYWGGQSGRTIFNAGRSGETSADVKGRLHRDILPRSANHVVLFIGTNDCGGPIGEDGQVSFDEFARNMEYLVGNLLDAGKPVTQVTLPPADNERMRAYFNDEIWTYDPSRIGNSNDFIRRQSERMQTGLADLAAEIDRRDVDPLMADGLHLNGQGQLILAELLASLLG